MKRSQNLIKGLALVVCVFGSIKAERPPMDKTQRVSHTSKMKAAVASARSKFQRAASDKVIVLNKTGEQLKRVTAFFVAKGTISERKATRRGHTSVENMMPGDEKILYARQAADKKGGNLMAKFADPSHIKTIQLHALRVGRTSREFPRDKALESNSFIITIDPGFLGRYKIETDLEFNERKAKEQRAQAAKEAAQANE